MLSGFRSSDPVQSSILAAAEPESPRKKPNKSLGPNPESALRIDGSKRLGPNGKVRSYKLSVEELQLKAAQAAYSTGPAKVDPPRDHSAEGPVQQHTEASTPDQPRVSDHKQADVLCPSNAAAQQQAAPSSAEASQTLPVADRPTINLSVQAHAPAHAQAASAVGVEALTPLQHETQQQSSPAASSPASPGQHGGVRIATVSQASQEHAEAGPMQQTGQPSMPDAGDLQSDGDHASASSHPDSEAELDSEAGSGGANPADHVDEQQPPLKRLQRQVTTS